MVRLRLAVAMLGLVVATPAKADPVARWRPLIEAASARCGMPAVWIAEVMRAESGGRTAWNGRPIVSRAGAMGLMQLMPGTWAEMRGELGLGPDPHRPRDNILAGACYLGRLYDRFGYPGLFAAYNAGPARYAAHLATGRRLPGETRAYLAGLAEAGAGYAAGSGVSLVAPPPRSRLFFIVKGGTAPAPGVESTSALFIARRGAAADAYPDR